MGTTNLANAPVSLQAGNYSAVDLRRMVTTMLGEGIVGANDFAVTQRAAGANMSVDVAAGQAYVKGDTITDQGHYFVRSSAVVNVPVTASDATNPRIDRVVLEIKDDAHDSSGLNIGRIRTIDGTPTAGATLTNLNGAAAVPNSCLLLSNHLVPAGATTVTTANMQDRRYGVPIPGKLMGAAVNGSSPNNGGGNVSNATNTGTVGFATVIGDGITPVSVRGRIKSLYCANNGPGHAELRLWDGTPGTGTLIASTEGYLTAATIAHPASTVERQRYPAFSGAKTFHMAMYNTSLGAATDLRANADSNSPIQMEVRWAG